MFFKYLLDIFCFQAPKVQKTDKLEDLDDEPQSKKHATDKKMMERKKILKEKKRALKRL